MSHNGHCSGVRLGQLRLRRGALRLRVITKGLRIVALSRSWTGRAAWAGPDRRQIPAAGYAL